MATHGLERIPQFSEPVRELQYQMRKSTTEVRYNQTEIQFIIDRAALRYDGLNILAELSDEDAVEFIMRFEKQHDQFGWMRCQD